MRVDVMQLKRSARIIAGKVIRIAGIIALLSAAHVIPAQTGAGYDLHWNVQSAGGGTMTGANGFVLNGTIAQTSPSPAGTMTGAAGYALHGGFWAGAHSSNDSIFRDGFDSTLPSLTSLYFGTDHFRAWRSDSPAETGSGSFSKPTK